MLLSAVVQMCLSRTIYHLRNRKHFPCFYRVMETRVFPQLFRVLPNLHEGFYNSIETQRKCFLFLLENSRPFSLSIQPLTAVAILNYGKRDFAEAEGRKTEIEERCMRRRRGGGRNKKFNAGPEGRNLAKETENQRGFA